MGYLSERVNELGDEARELGSVGEHLARQNELLEIIAQEAVGGSDSYIDTSTDDPSERGSGEYAAFAGLSVTGTEQVVSWNFTADAIAVKGHDQPILVAMKGQDSDARWIDLRPDADDPFTIGGGFSIEASRLWFKLAPAATADTSMTVIAAKEA